MKNVFLFLCILLVFTCVKAAFGEEGEHMFTSGRANGYYVVEMTEKGKVSASKVRAYIYGVLDTLSETNTEGLRKLYPDATFAGIADSIISFYRDNSSQRGRTVVDLVLSGCKRKEEKTP
jgi:hypothetical protein